MTALIPLPAHLETDPTTVWRGSRVRVTGGEEFADAALVGVEMLTCAGIEVIADDGGASESRPLTIRVTSAEQPPDVAPAIGVHPTVEATDERYTLEVSDGAATIAAPHPAGVVRAFATLIQLLATTREGEEFALPQTRIADGPRFAWRGLSLDVARRFYAVEDVCTIIDLLAAYKLNVLHLHLTDDQAWRLEIPTWPELTEHPEPGLEGHYTTDELHLITGYAAARHITVVPEIDLPGHCRAVLRAYPHLTDCAQAPPELTAALGDPVALDPDDPEVRRFVTDVMAHVATLARGRFIHIGADEAWGMPHEKLSRFVAFAAETVAGLGKTAIGWQEAARAGLTPPNVVQHWINIDPDELRDAASTDAPDVVAEFFAGAIRTADGDARLAVDAGLPLVLSPTRWAYLDTPYSEPSAREGQEAERARLGLPHYPPRSIEQFFDWDPLTVQSEVGPDSVAGVEACIWGETITGPADLQFLLLPRLPGVAEKGWSQPTTWADYEPRLAEHGALWSARNLNWYAAAGVAWR